MTTEQVLRKFGLSQNEAKVYLALLQIEKGGASVVGGKTGMGRNAARNNCQTLVKKGLVREERKGNAFFYFAEPPEKIFSVLEEQRKAIAQMQVEAGNIIGILKAMRNPALMCPDIQYYEGREGIIEIYDDILRVGENHCMWTNLEKKHEIFGETIKSHVKKRAEKKIKIQSIRAKTPESAVEAKIFGLHREVKLVDSLPISNGEIIIYKDRVAIITFNNRKPAGFVFKNLEIARMFSGLFASYWRLLD